MDPPSYDEARLHPLAHGLEVPHIPPPPSYDASLNSPPTPPPTYREAVDFVPDHFPVLSPPTRSQQNTGIPIHPSTEVVINPSINVPQTTPVVIYQPQPFPTVAPSQLTDSPGQVVCPHCGRTGTTLITQVPGGAAWCMCTMLALIGLMCGFCLIPLLVRSLQDAHHSCPHCKKMVHIYKR